MEPSILIQYGVIAAAIVVIVVLAFTTYQRTTRPESNGRFTAINELAIELSKAKELNSQLKVRIASLEAQIKYSETSLKLEGAIENNITISQSGDGVNIAGQDIDIGGSATSGDVAGGDVSKRGD